MVSRVPAPGQRHRRVRLEQPDEIALGVAEPGDHPTVGMGIFPVTTVPPAPAHRSRRDQ